MTNSTIMQITSIRKIKLISLSLVSILSIAILLQSCASERKNPADSRSRPFDSDWRFIRDSVSAESPAFDDSKWRSIDLPHDWSIEDIPQQEEGKTIGPFSKESPGGTATGHVVGGTGWYRKKFMIAAEDTGKSVSIYFEGVYMESDVWINGRHL
jgi:beta-galactosidase